MDSRSYNSLIFSPRIAQEIGEDEGTAYGRSDSAAENKNFLFVFNSIVCACRNAAAGRDWFVISNNMKKHFLLIAFALLLFVGCGNQNKVDQEQPSEVCVWKDGQWTTDWMQKYVEYARGKDNLYTDRRIMDEWQYWGLAYIDNDTIPEMLLYGSEAAGCKVLTIYEGKVSEWNSWRCGVSYIPKSGLINNEDGSMGHYYDRIVKLENGEYTVVYMINYYEDVDYVDSNYVYCQGNKYSISDSPKEYERYTDDSVKQALYTSIGQSVDINTIDSRYPTAFFEKDWTPAIPDNVAEEAYTLTLTVK